VNEKRKGCKVSSAAAIRVRAYPLMRNCVEMGVAYGLRHAFQHDPQPPAFLEDAERFEVVADGIVSAVMGDVCDAFWFEPEPDES